EALRYAKLGRAVLPLHVPSKDGDCSCGKADCKDDGKHPRTWHGVNDATTDELTIREWLKRWPGANIGIATGAVSGIFVIDEDRRNGGDKELQKLETIHGPLPEGPLSLTGDGRHFIFKHPGFPVNVSKIAPGLDIRGDGGYIVAPCS